MCCATFFFLRRLIFNCVLDDKNNYRKGVHCIATHANLNTIMASNRKKNDAPSRTPLATKSGQNNNASLPQICDIRRFKKEHPFLSTLLREDGILFECDGEAPSPSKDYGQLQITMDKVCFIK